MALALMHPSSPLVSPEIPIVSRDIDWGYQYKTTNHGFGNNRANNTDKNRARKKMAAKSRRINRKRGK